MRVGEQSHRYLLSTEFQMNTLLSNVAFVTTLLLQVLVLYLLSQQRLQRRFFWFLAYIVYELCESALRFATVGNHDLYYRVYWLTAIGGVVFTVLAFRESFLNIFRVYTRLRWFTRTIWGCVGLALLYAVLKAWLFPPVNRGWQTQAIIGLELALEYSLSVVGILYFACMGFFKIRGHHWESGVILGFTIYASLAICGFLTRSIFGQRFNLVSTWTPALAYLIGGLTWVLELSRPENKPSSLPRNLTIDDLTKVEQYISTLGRLFGRKP